MDTPAPLLDTLDTFASARVLCLGDIMLDRFVHGAVERISPEAPIPVLRVTHEETMLGGMGNVARNIRALGGAASCIGVIGEDSAGAEVHAMLEALSPQCIALVRDGARQTSIKTRFLATTQQMLRADQETIAPLSAETERKIIAGTRHALANCDVVVLSDYGKGALSPAVLDAVISSALAERKTVIIDPKGRDYTRYRGATMITPNLKELAEASAMAVEGDDAVVRAARHLMEIADIASVLATRSAEGMTLVLKDGPAHHLKARAREVFDVSGAGDTVVAAMACALGGGAAMETAAALANIAAGVVVGKVGTAVAYPADVVAEHHRYDTHLGEGKIMTLSSADDRIRAWRRSGFKIGFTNGCFDLLHPGHLSLLSQARKACDKLVIGLNSDASVKRLKGPSRPVQSEMERAMVLASLGMIDAVVIFSEDTPLTLIEALRPDVLVKGADYTLETVVGADIVRAYGGRVVLAQIKPGHSTTSTIAKLNA
ncbi:D-glycero-beta-D-manno-heptose-7-phosphate kinase [Varunaivibrio sulfuroxidans]|uniref:Bifunctional protein HldE n=1 Tax=Varunaivibrio sulfuroxidans TaxID=1773489 RepID=A0A4R3JJR1_9PROT|nr:D-glycero-beta-D-manno-heptose-7-phosphate kinase [Varunaivibrio sulfuroxidans]TCS65130.1 D-alpha,beta-D-heptose 7-phosphate 1-kinase /D-beta-D-heptose 1-phosphate adenylyltransferase [Varunaivibrio sulfuroxidans]WES29584.1 D-glycero-beta-D-manno-heptose-7-phosphate kinase [Varunaivibrio sulfuroxidans]